MILNFILKLATPPCNPFNQFAICFLGRTKIQVAVLDGNGTPVPYTKINYVDSKDYIDSSGLNQRWTDDLGKKVVFHFNFIDVFENC